MDKLSRSFKHPPALALLAVLSATLAGCSLLPKEENALKPPLVKPAQENYRTVKVERGTIVKQIKGIGSLESVSTYVAQFTGQGGRLQSIAVKSGDKVKKGDVLVQLIMDDLDLKLKEQELSLERAKLALRQAKAAGSGQLRIASLQLEIEQIKYDRLKEQLGGKQLRSNIDGQVIFVESLKEGDFVEPYQTLVTVADPTKLRVSLRVENAADIRDAEVGMSAEVTVRDAKVVGKVVQTPSSAPQTLNKDLQEKYGKTLYIEIPDLPKDAEIGSMADVAIVTQKKDNVLLIPRSGLRSYLGRNFVRVLEDGKRIRELDVEQGLTGSTTVEIVQGVEEGQDVILQ
ncbi:HlyD family efflux transporter periplasmic adaptor subunit [Cohnella sp. CFH 77786]|uniref:efflux RND transporter periplasmic adaptor subunit n=1 Tax=Cohnella sp. CFH 77786 TaxID=2662265 RepID=UPI001C60DA4B|nr:efflux RND transporter periplasmic adaptor subunit [Cohnella sp. CFH 77786]MBW5447962.1 HlyD family efflux transporter periplasmic adaptor subunit [Cohnella sp. CFH 77786]